jgi:hypothetical protein
MPTDVVGPAVHSKMQNMRSFTCLYFVLCVSATVVLATKPPNGHLSTSEQQQVSKQGTQSQKPMVAANQKPWPLGSANATILAPEGAPFDFPPPATITTN